MKQIDAIISILLLLGLFTIITPFILEYVGSVPSLPSLAVQIGMFILMAALLGIVTYWILENVEKIPMWSIVFLMIFLIAVIFALQYPVFR